MVSSCVSERTTLGSTRFSWCPALCSLPSPGSSQETNPWHAQHMLQRSMVTFLCLRLYVKGESYTKGSTLFLLRWIVAQGFCIQYSTPINYVTFTLSYICGIFNYLWSVKAMCGSFWCQTAVFLLRKVLYWNGSYKNGTLQMAYPKK